MKNATFVIGLIWCCYLFLHDCYGERVFERQHPDNIESNRLGTKLELNLTPENFKQTITTNEPHQTTNGRRKTTVAQSSRSSGSKCSSARSLGQRIRYRRAPEYSLERQNNQKRVCLVRRSRQISRVDGRETRKTTGNDMRRMVPQKMVERRPETRRFTRNSKQRNLMRENFDGSAQKSSPNIHDSSLDTRRSVQSRIDANRRLARTRSTRLLRESSSRRVTQSRFNGNRNEDSRRSSFMRSTREARGQSVESRRVVQSRSVDRRADSNGRLSLTRSTREVRGTSIESRRMARSRSVDSRIDANRRLSLTRLTREIREPNADSRRMARSRSVDIRTDANRRSSLTRSTGGVRETSVESRRMARSRSVDSRIDANRRVSLTRSTREVRETNANSRRMARSRSVDIRTDANRRSSLTRLTHEARAARVESRHMARSRSVDSRIDANRRSSLTRFTSDVRETSVESRRMVRSRSVNSRADANRRLSLTRSTHEARDARVESRRTARSRSVDSRIDANRRLSLTRSTREVRETSVESRRMVRSRSVDSRAHANRRLSLTRSKREVRVPNVESRHMTRSRSDNIRTDANRRVSLTRSTREVRGTSVESRRMALSRSVGIRIGPNRRLSGEGVDANGRLSQTRSIRRFSGDTKRMYISDSARNNLGSTSTTGVSSLSKKNNANRRLSLIRSTHTARKLSVDQRQVQSSRGARESLLPPFNAMPTDDSVNSRHASQLIRSRKLYVDTKANRLSPVKGVMDFDFNMKKLSLNTHPKIFRDISLYFDVNTENLLIDFKPPHIVVSPEHFEFESAAEMADGLPFTNNSASSNSLPREQSAMSFHRTSTHFDEINIHADKVSYGIKKFDLTKDTKQNADSIFKQSTDSIPNLILGINWHSELPQTVIFGLVAVLGMRSQKEGDTAIGSRLSSLISAIF